MDGLDIAFAILQQGEDAEATARHEHRPLTPEEARKVQAAMFLRKILPAPDDDPPLPPLQ